MRTGRASTCAGVRQWRESARIYPDRIGAPHDARRSTSAYADRAPATGERAGRIQSGRPVAKQRQPSAESSRFASARADKCDWLRIAAHGSRCCVAVESTLDDGHQRHKRTYPPARSPREELHVARRQALRKGAADPPVVPRGLATTLAHQDRTLFDAGTGDSAATRGARGAQHRRPYGAAHHGGRR